MKLDTFTPSVVTQAELERQRVKSKPLPATLDLKAEERPEPELPPALVDPKKLN